MNRLLIFYNKNNMKPIGGPSGYLYNLSHGLDSIDHNQLLIEFLDEPASNGRKKLNLVKQLPGWISSSIIDHYTLYKYSHLLKSSENNRMGFDKYDAVHFHSTLDLYKCREELNHYRGAVILSSHCPKAHHREICEDSVSHRFYLKHKQKMDLFSKFDEYSFNRADYIVFPCEEAMEPYFQSWKEFKTIYQKNQSKFRYLLSGIKKVSAKDNKYEVRQRYGIPQNAMVLSYVGRHNATKGYDLLIDLFYKTNDIYFLIAGDNQGVDYPKDKRWIEVGWTDDPYSIVGASDCFVLPNKQTYFDLVLLEVLSLGKTVLISETGGNKHFHQYNLDSIRFFEDISAALDQISDLVHFSSMELEKMGKQNETLFDKVFNCEVFAKKYCSLIDSIIT